MSAAVATRYVQHVMGMPISLALRGRHLRDAAAHDAWGGFLDSLHASDAVFSTYREDSAISRIRRGELAVDDCPPEVAEVLALGRAAEQESTGAFTLWQRAADGRLRLDPTGVVKGWAVDRAAPHLAALDGTDFCVSAGGDVLCRTVDADAEPWRIGVEDPHDPTRVLAVIPVRQGGVATSGTAHRGQHLVDGRTGRPPAGVASVTVVAATLTEADIDATAAYAHGSDAARWLRRRTGRVGLVVWPDGTTTTTTAN